ncbi:hypothetical protein [Botrimarina sp.]|uniref:hypothetical protein n=1 Tax=Botrimarina sp. TaxID=2795802 RepID=UPI0032ECCD11
MSRRRRGASAGPVSLFAFQDIVTTVTGVLLLVALTMALRVAETREDASVESLLAERDRLEASLAGAEARADDLASRVDRLDDDFVGTADLNTRTAAETLAAAQDESASLRAQIAELTAAAESREREAQQLSERLADEAAQRIARLLEQQHEAERRLEQIQSSNRMLFNLPDPSAGPILVVELFPDYALAAEAGVRQRPRRFDGGDWPGTLAAWLGDQPPASRWMLFCHPGAVRPLETVRETGRELDRDVGFDLIPGGVIVVDPEHGVPPSP